MDSGTATEAVVRQVGVHKHQVANRCSLGENFKDRDRDRWTKVTDTETEEHGMDSGTATEAVVSSGGAPAPVGKSMFIR